ncbi:hypothetical protein [Hymenobacter terrenus]|uniref:hypothetical protein n=1 Tax=Hymenobacter terrenus TaxID=1629124 RepID=UPI0006197F69|nr:hypothetical protein [Hymenobacter terrenus]
MALSSMPSTPTPSTPAITRQDLNELILDIIKVHPDANDATKLQGKRHRALLNAILDYVDARGGSGAGDGEFAFDWTVPSNAFGNYSNNETTFASGMWKFLHRDTPPTASLTASNARRQKGSNPAVTLSWDVRQGSSQLVANVVNGSNQPTPIQRFGSLVTTAPGNVDKSFALQVTDARGLQAIATALVQYRQLGFIVPGTLVGGYKGASATAVSENLQFEGAVGLLDNRFMNASVTCEGQPIVIAFPASMLTGGTQPTIVVNTLIDNSFTMIIFPFTNSDGFVEDYALLVGGNDLFGTYTVQVQ